MANDLLSQVIDFIINLVTSFYGPQIKAPEPKIKEMPPIQVYHVDIEVPIQPVAANEAVSPEIDWTNPTYLITPHFSVDDALTLHNWHRLANQKDGANFVSLTALCQKMEQVREALGCPIKVHCMYRSPAYNQEQKIKPNDAHSLSLACDFDCSPALTIQQAKDKLEPLLEKLSIRMERGTTNWLHIDMKMPGITGRYFTP